MNSGELKVDVPLASVESDTEDSLPPDGAEDQHNGVKTVVQRSNPAEVKTNSSGISSQAQMAALDGGNSMSGSLEDLVNSFDEKLASCFKNYEEKVEKIAPVQVRSHEEIMNECQVWWTLTGNFGSMMPIDWSKSTTRAKHLEALNLKNSQDCSFDDSGGRRRWRGGRKGADECCGGCSGDELEDEDDIVAADLDMHSLILSSGVADQTDPVKSADEVIKEIDEIIDREDEDAAAVAGDGHSGDDPGGKLGDDGSRPKGALVSRTSGLFPGLPLSARRIFGEALQGRKLEDLSANELTQILGDVEILVKELSEELVSDLNVRDELEYEKELKNTFISLLLSVQSRRRSLGGREGGGAGSNAAVPASAGGNHGPQQKQQQQKKQQQQQKQQQQPLYKYLTTVIPYQPDKGVPSLQGLQILVKILKAINEDSPAVPALLTDYILKVLCP